MIVVDSREDDKLLKFFGDEQISVEALPVGDYFLKDKNILIERKTISDFISSYISHHLQEQLENMEVNFETYYLFISGHYNYFSVKNTPYKYFTEASFNKCRLHLYNSFPGLRIVEFANDKQLIEGVVELQNYVGSARCSELVKRQVSREDEFLSVLCCFKGLSLRKAKGVALVCGDVHCLIERVSVCDDKQGFGVAELNKKDFAKLKDFFQKPL